MCRLNFTQWSWGGFRFMHVHNFLLSCRRRVVHHGAFSYLLLTEDNEILSR